jgi:hypothetical protein
VHIQLPLLPVWRLSRRVGLQLVELHGFFINALFVLTTFVVILFLARTFVKRFFAF